jgi:hypothetical protein
MNGIRHSPLPGALMLLGGFDKNMWLQNFKWLH